MSDTDLRLSKKQRLSSTAKSKTAPNDMLADIGRALYGERWRLSLARGVNVDDDTIRRWMTGRTELPADHGAFADALALMRQREKEIGDAADELERWIKMSGPSPSAS